MMNWTGAATPLEHGLLPGVRVRGARREAPAAICALPMRACILYALAWQIAAFVLLAVQFLLVCTLGPLGLLAGLAGLVVLFIYRPLAGTTVFLQVLLYQNLFLSIFSGLGMDKASFSAAQGFAFAAVAGMAVVSVLRIAQSATRHGESARLTRWTIASLAVVVVYTCYGAVASSPASAAIYFRNSSAMLFALLVGVDVGRTWDYRTVAIIFVSSIAVGLFLSVIEYAAPETYYTAINARDYIHLRTPDGDTPEISRSVNEVIASRIVTWFNVTGGAGASVSVRIFGPNMLAVSYAYVIAAFGIVAATVGRPGLVGLALCLLIFAGVKGPLVLLVITLAIFLMWWVIRNRILFLLASLALLTAYVFLGIRTGMNNGDFHVIGLLGGVNGFLKMPWGHGIGVGGNLSETALNGLDWEAWQKSGVDFALESSVGVLLYQMGVAAAAVYAPVAGLLRQGFAGTAAPRPSRRGGVVPRPIGLLFIGIAVALVNGVFQEEAYSPYALGLLTLLGGIAASNGSAQRVAA
jgi:hypothetical protein